MVFSLGRYLFSTSPQRFGQGIAVVLFFALFLVACRPTPTPTVDVNMDSYVQPEWIDQYIRDSLHVKQPLHCFLTLQKSIPQKWQRPALEGFYYHLPEKLDDGLVDRWLDTAYDVLTDQNVRSFLKMIEGQRLIEKGEYRSAVPRLQESYELALQERQYFRANDARRYLARSYMLQGDYPVALSLLLKVHGFLEGKPDLLHQVRKFETMMEIMRVHQLVGDYPKALYWGKKALRYAQPEQWGQMVIVGERLAETWLSIDQPDSAWHYLQLSAAWRNQFQVRHDVTNWHYMMGKALIARGGCREALDQLQRAASGNLEQFNRRKIAAIQLSLADAYSCLGNGAAALRHYQDALAITPDTAAIADIHYKIAGLYEQQGRFRESLLHTQLGARFSNISYNAEKGRALGKIESQLALERTENRIKLLAANQRSHQFQIALVLILCLSAATVLAFAYDRQRRRRRSLESERKLLYAEKVIQEQKLRIAALSLTEKEKEVDALQQLIELKNNLIASLEQKIVPPEPDANGRPLRMLTDLDWEVFRDSFERQFPGYLQRVKMQFPKITHTEVRLFLFIKVGLDNLEISSISGISLESVYRNRTRLRQKLGLGSSENLEQFVYGF